MLSQSKMNYPLICYGQQEPGSAGLLVRRRGNKSVFCLVSAAHVLSPLPWSIPSKGDPIFAVDDPEGLNPMKIGTLDNWIQISDVGEFVADAAIAELSADIISRGLPGGIGVPSEIGNDLFVGMDVKIFSVARQKVKGSKIVQLNYSDSLRYVDDDDSERERFIRFRNVVLCKPAYSEAGDSGSVVLNNSNQVVGLHFWGNEVNDISIFAPIEPILDQFEVELAGAPDL